MPKIPVQRAPAVRIPVQLQPARIPIENLMHLFTWKLSCVACYLQTAQSAEFGDRFGYVPSVRTKVYSDEYMQIRGECLQSSSESIFSTVKNQATVNFYPTTKDFQDFNNYDLIPELTNNYKDARLRHKGSYGTNNEGIEITFQHCDLSVQGDYTWTVERIGPFISTGGYDWWQIGWEDVFGFEHVLQKHQHGIVADRNVIVPVDSDGNLLGNPPIHVHHIHVSPSPGVRPRNSDVHCGLRPRPCYNGSWLMEWHGDYQCREEDGGVLCMLESLPEGYGKTIEKTWDIEGELNDVRRRGSEKMEFYLETAIRWRPRNLVNDLKVWSQLTNHGVPNRYDTNNQQTYVGTFPSPMAYDSFAWATYIFPGAGKLIRGKAHVHAQYFYKMLWVGGDISRIIDESYLVPALQPWIATDVRKHGFTTSSEMSDDFKERIDADSHLTLICLVTNDLEVIGSMSYDRMPRTNCREYFFTKDEPYFVVGWNVKKSYPLTLDEKPDFNGIIVPGTLPQHFGLHFWYEDSMRDSTRVVYAVPRRTLKYSRWSPPFIACSDEPPPILFIYALYYTMGNEPELSPVKFAIKFCTIIILLLSALGITLGFPVWFFIKRKIA